MFYLFVVVFLLAVVKYYIRQLITRIQTQSDNFLPTVSLTSFAKCILFNKFDARLCLPGLVKAYGTSFRVNVFGFYSCVFLHDTKKLQKLFLSGDLGHAQKPEFYKRIIPKPGHNGLILSNVDLWTFHRKVISKAFTYKGLVSQVEIFDEQAKELIFNLDNMIANSTTNNISQIYQNNKFLSRMIHKSSLKVAAKIIAGKTNLLTENDYNRFFDLFERGKTLTFSRLVKPLLALDFVWNLHPYSNEAAKLETESLAIAARMLTKARQKYSIHEEYEDEETGNKTILENMIQSGFSDEEIYTEFITLVTTGHETVSQSLNILLFYLAKNPEIQGKCFDEVQKLFGRLNNANASELNIEYLTDLKYLEMCIKEELRLYPTAPIIGRKLESPLIFDDNTHLDMGTNIFISSWLIHRNEEIYPDPEKFDPNRFLTENCKNHGICDYMPFSVGLRNCIAWKSAMLEMKIYAAYVLYNFEVYIDKDNHVKLNLNNLLPVPDLGVKLKRR